MKKLINKTWLQIAICALLFASCQKAVERAPGSGNGPAAASSLSNARIAADECLTTLDSVSGTGTGFGYTNWTPVTKALASGPTLQYEGQFVSFVRPVTANWYIGTVDLGNTCDSWETLLSNNSISIKNEHLGGSPANIYNVVGYNTPTYGLGYYTYADTEPTVTANIVVWYDPNGGSDEEYISDLNDATAAYIVQVQDIVPAGNPPSLTSKVIYKYYKVL